MRIPIAIALAVILTAAPAAAQLNCWWNGIGMQCQKGWLWNERERHEERMREREERRELRPPPEPHRQEWRGDWCRERGLWYRC